MFLILMLALFGNPIEVRSEYVCHGNSPNGTYDILLSVEKKEANYNLTWKTNEVQAKGVGIRDGNNLAVLYVNPKGMGGVMLYRVSRGGLDGIWSGGDGKVYTETCTVGVASMAEDEQ